MSDAGVPPPGDEEWNAYAVLFNDVTRALPLTLSGAILFSQRRHAVNALWRLGYRPPADRVTDAARRTRIELDRVGASRTSRP